jgi:uncharacterized membrane protein
MSSAHVTTVPGQAVHAGDEAARVAISTETIGGRLTAVDAIRGLIMVLMALDHTRDFLQDLRIDALDPETTTIPLYFTRWVTHLCATMFVFLAGASVYLAGAMRKWSDRFAQARFVAARGIFLIFLELTLVRIVSQFNWSYDGLLLQVIWAIGWSFLILAALVACRVKAHWVGLLGAAIVLGHNLLEITPLGAAQSPPIWVWLRTFLLRPGGLDVAPGVTWISAYPILPWFGVMALGYAFGRALLLERPARLRITLGLGILLCLAFVGLRASAFYGDPAPWTIRDTLLKSFLAFLNCLKYPPSLLFVLMMLGPGLLILAAFEAVEKPRVPAEAPGPIRRILITFGRVPLFYYLIHWAVIHAIANIINKYEGVAVPWNRWGPDYTDFVPDYGYGLPLVYMVWISVVAIVYWPCRWFAELRRRRRDLTWLSYF